jgi:predicted MFS family arabinose efflux permease
MLDKMSPLRNRLAEAFTPLGGVFRNRDLRRVQLAWIGTLVGQWAYYVALAVFAYEEGGAAALGLVALIRTIPAAVSAPVSSMLSDRYQRERVMLVAHIGRTVVLVGAVFALYADSPVAVYTAAGLMTVFGTAIKPAQAALLPSLAATPEELSAANVTFRSVESISIFVGPAIGGFLLAAANEEVVFAAAAAAAAWAALLVARVRPGAVAAPRERAAEGLFQELAAGFRTLAAEPGLRLIAALMTLHWFIGGAVNVLVVAAAIDLLDLGASGVGLLNSAIGVGGVLGTVAALILVTREHLASDLGFSLLIRGAAIILIGVVPETIVALPLLVVMGVGNTVIDVSGTTLLQRVAPDEVLARVFGALHTMLILGLGLGASLVPVLIDVAGIDGALIGTGAVLFACTAVSARGLARVRPLPPALVQTRELLGSVPLFAPLAPAVLEYLAGKVTTVQRPAGHVIFRQGDAGDEYYLVGEGEVEVSIDGQVVSTLGPGEAFGEIALLRDVPRTATVTAKTDVTLHALERDEFLAAVTDNPGSARAADRVIADRLGTAAPEVARI